MQQGKHDLLIDAGGAHFSERLHLRYRAEEKRRHRQRIDAHVEQRAATQFGIEHAVLGREIGDKADIGLHLLQHADFAAGDDALRFLHGGQETAPHGFHQKQLFIARQVDHALRFARVHGERFFAHDVLAGGQAQQGVFRMQGVRRGDVDHVHAGVHGQRLVGPVATFDAEFGAKGLCAGIAARSDRHQLRAGRIAQALGHRAGDLAGAEDAPADGVLHALLSFCASCLALRAEHRRVIVKIVVLPLAPAGQTEYG